MKACSAGRNFIGHYNININIFINSILIKYINKEIKKNDKKNNKKMKLLLFIINKNG
jgi:hypothetical protein